MKLVEIVGQNIANRRKAIGLSQKELAARLDITQDALNRMEKGQIAPKMSRLDDIARILQCPVPYLFRSANNAFSARCAVISDILASLPADAQEVLVGLVTDLARVINQHRN